jgi:hypothetical protein
MKPKYQNISTDCALDKSSVHRPKNLLVFINPFGGKGQALSIFNTTVAPLFRAAGVKYKVTFAQILILLTY